MKCNPCQSGQHHVCMGATQRCTCECAHARKAILDDSIDKSRAERGKLPLHLELRARSRRRTGKRKRL